jgi:hypothetical protein
MPRRLVRIGLSAVILAHLAAVALWNLPGGNPLRQQLAPYVGYYLLPTGQWQYWGMFCPDPVRDTHAAEAAVRDSQGMIHTYQFPRMADKSVWDASWGFRHSKFLHNLAPEAAVAYREFAARHAARALDLPPEAYPIEMDLYYKRWRTPPLGTAPDLLAPPDIVVLRSYRFPAIEDVQP